MTFQIALKAIKAGKVIPNMIRFGISSLLMQRHIPSRPLLGLLHELLPSYELMGNRAHGLYFSAG
jgi:hypothetical protein